VIDLKDSAIEENIIHNQSIWEPQCNEVTKLLYGLKYLTLKKNIKINNRKREEEAQSRKDRCYDVIQVEDIYIIRVVYQYICYDVM